MATAMVVFWWTVRLAILGMVALYSGLVLTSYTTDGAHYPLRLDLDAPARSLQQILVWSGVRLLDLAVRFLRVVLDLLAEASADVGEWFVNKRSPKVQAEIRSRFL
jgi:hypothetical protein